MAMENGVQSEGKGGSGSKAGDGKVYRIIYTIRLKWRGAQKANRRKRESEREGVKGLLWAHAYLSIYKWLPKRERIKERREGERRWRQTTRPKNVRN